ncbi:hypothetical protein RB597_001571 [Gaeumannomyces tritici]
MADRPQTVIYLSPTGPVVQEITDAYRPEGSQSLIRVDYSGINPADIRHAGIGWHSSVAGYDMAGEVISVGPDSPFKPKDRIFGVNPPGRSRPLYHGAHQDYAIAEAIWFRRIPEGGSLDARTAAALPVVTQTAADALFHCMSLSFPEANIQGEVPAGKHGILVWGGSGAVGMAAIQLAKAAGHGPILTTAGRRNHDALRALGADHTFDYKDTDVVEQIRAVIRKTGKPVKLVFDAVCNGAFDQGEAFQRSSMVRAAHAVGADQVEEGYKLVGVLPVSQDPRWKLCAGHRTKGPARGPIDFTTDNVQAWFEMMGKVWGFTTDNVQAWSEMMGKVWGWVTRNYGPGRFHMPNVRTFHGLEGALEAMQLSANGQVHNQLGCKGELVAAMKAT